MANLSNVLGQLKLLTEGKVDVGVSSTGIAWLKLTSLDGSARYFFINNSGTFKVHTAEPTADGDGSNV